MRLTKIVRLLKEKNIDFAQLFRIYYEIVDVRVSMGC